MEDAFVGQCGFVCEHALCKRHVLVGRVAVIEWHGRALRLVVVVLVDAVLDALDIMRAERSLLEQLARHCTHACAVRRVHECTEGDHVERRAALMLEATQHRVHQQALATSIRADEHARVAEAVDHRAAQ